MTNRRLRFCTAALVPATMLLSASCDRRTPVAPTPLPGSPGAPTLSGVVRDRASGQPVAGVLVHTYQQTSQVYSQQTSSDAEGRYSVSTLIEGVTAWVFARGGRRRQQCAVSVTPQGTATLDLTVADIADPVRLGESEQMRVPGTRALSGVVFEQTPLGREPLTLAWVGWEPFGANKGIVAEAITDTRGRYLLCGLPDTTLPGLFATAPGYDVTFIAAGASDDVDLDIEVKRCTTRPIEAGEGRGCT